MNAGTVILTGTPAGVGFARTPPVYLRPGDMVEVCAPSGMLLPQHIVTAIVNVVQTVDYLLIVTEGLAFK
jgi:2-keto-4-pentenoate hydratase/2-oxohepta-3-ene-1,7-dioic acid hydratase in catechol pathway